MLCSLRESRQHGRKSDREDGVSLVCADRNDPIGQKYSRLARAMLRDTPYFFMLTQCLYPPPAAALHQPVNSRGAVLIRGSLLGVQQMEPKKHGRNRRGFVKQLF